MNTLFVLVGAFIISVMIRKLAFKKYDLALSGRISMAVMLFFTAFGHFLFLKGMVLMIPSFIPFKTALVYLTAVLEIVTGLYLLYPSTYRAAGWVLIMLLVILLPANIKAALDQVDYRTASFTGPGRSYLYFRIPLQFFFVAWTYWSAIKVRPSKPEAVKERLLEDTANDGRKIFKPLFK